GRIRVIATDDHSVTGSGVSPADFTISDKGIGVNLTAPLGGETFVTGENVTVSWTVSASDQPFIKGFDLLLSTDGGLTFPTRIANSADPGAPALSAGATSFQWAVPTMCSTNSKLAVVATSLTGLTTSSSSPNPFAVQDVGPTIDITAMSFPKSTGQMKLVATSVGSNEVLFDPAVTLEVSSDQAGTQFFAFANTKLKNHGRKLFSVGNINKMNPNKFFPNGATRVLRITNPPCGITLITVTRKGNSLVSP
ncbi:MAG: hypothetical protein ACREAC_32705, partial [Blastocatellia bacterium]